MADGLKFNNRFSWFFFILTISMVKTLNIKQDFDPLQINPTLTNNSDDIDNSNTIVSFSSEYRRNEAETEESILGF